LILSEWGSDMGQNLISLGLPTSLRMRCAQVYCVVRPRWPLGGPPSACYSGREAAAPPRRDTIVWYDHNA